MKPNIFIPQTLPQAIRRPLKQLDERTRPLDAFGGEQFTGGAVPGTMPAQHPYMFIWGKIRDDESGSGSGTGSGHIDNFIGAGFNDREGYLAYSFDQVYDHHPWKGEVIPGGISTVILDDLDGYNFAYPPPPFPEFNVGDVVLLFRSGRHWTIVGSAASAFGSGGGPVWEIECTATGATARRVN